MTTLSTWDAISRIKVLTEGLEPKVALPHFEDCCSSHMGIFCNINGLFLVYLVLFSLGICVNSSNWSFTVS